MKPLARRERMRNTAAMGHSGNWSERKVAMEVDRLRTAERTRAASAQEVDVYAIDRGQGVDIYALNPCETARRNWRVEALCAGCRRLRNIELPPLLASAWAHAPWVRIMALLVCGGCSGRPEEITFLDKGVSGVDRHFMAKLTLRRPTDEELSALTREKRKVWATRTFTPDELVWRKPGFRR